MGADFGYSVASAGDVNGDGYGDVIVGAFLYDAGENDEGAAFVFVGNDAGRLVQASQLRGDGSGLPVQPGGLAYASDGFEVSMQVTSPRGRELAKLEVEACPLGAAFGDPTCATRRTPRSLTQDGVRFQEPLGGLAPNALYRWRARAL